MSETPRPHGTIVRGRPPMTELRRAQLRLELSRHAVRLFRDQGVAATSGEQIAEAAGLSARTLWRYFPTKESCVEPVLTASVEAFAGVLRSWPVHRTLAEHLRGEYGGTREAPTSSADQRIVLDVVRLARDEPGVRGVWLLVHERSEPVFAEILAARTGRRGDEFDVRVHAAAVNAALRIATEEHAWHGGVPPERPGDYLGVLTSAMDVAFHGLTSG